MGEKGIRVSTTYQFALLYMYSTFSYNIYQCCPHWLGKKDGERDTKIKSMSSVTIFILYATKDLYWQVIPATSQLASCSYCTIHPNLDLGVRSEKKEDTAHVLGTLLFMMVRERELKRQIPIQIPCPCWCSWILSPKHSCNIILRSKTSAMKRCTTPVISDTKAPSVYMASNHL